MNNFIFKKINVLIILSFHFPLKLDAQLTQIITNNVNDYYSKWSPDRKSISFTKEISQEVSSLLIPVKGVTAEKISISRDGNLIFDWSSNGSKLNQELESTELFQFPPINKKPGHYSKEDWQAIIDSFWGTGLPTTEKLAIFDAAWNEINLRYGAFHNLEVNIDSLRDLYRPEIEKGVSRGRFTAIMNHMAFALKDNHTWIVNRPVNWYTPLNPGVPVFVIGAWKENGRFGACLTPMEDSTLLVFKALPNHVLGLEAGDIVLGYDGILWKDLYKNLLKAELPLQIEWVWGSNDYSITHCILMSAGLNWHLFDTIDFIKYSTGDTLHLRTSLLKKQTGRIWPNEQLDVPGVEWPDIYQNDFVSWGIVEGTQIGYVYVTAWDPNSQPDIAAEFYEAVHSLMYEYETTGLIFDYRLNYGGQCAPSQDGYALLFNTNVFTIAYEERTDPLNHYGMHPSSWATPSHLQIYGNPNSYYDKPIAMLIGPGTISAGDVHSLRLQFHEKVRTFGKPSNGAFTISDFPDLGNSNWFFQKAYGTAYLISDHIYLAHTSVSVDAEVWLTQAGVVNGTDDVVAAAIEWINNTTVIDNSNSPQQPLNFELFSNYPNPFNPKTKIKYAVPVEAFITLKVYDILGREIVVLINEKKTVGIYEVEFDGTELACGVYFCRMHTKNFHQTMKMVLAK